MERDKSLFWFDGRMVPSSDATINIASHSLQSGFAVLEGIRCYGTASGPAFFRLDAHLRRLFDSAKILGLDVTRTPEELLVACCQVIRENGMDEGYLRPIAFLGMGDLGIGARNNERHLAVMAWKWGSYLGEAAHTVGVRAKISSFTRNHINSTMCRAKTTGGYVNSILARMEANNLGFDEAIFLDAQGYVAEGTGENLFIVRDGRLFTAPAATVLPGITRASVMELAETLSILVTERLFTRDDLYTADEAFFTGTAAEVTPIREVDGRKIGAGRPGDITCRVQAAFEAAARGRNTIFEKWLHRL